MIVIVRHGSKILVHDLRRLVFRLLQKYTIICDTKKLYVDGIWDL
jgi:hypothetical protein